MTAQTMLQTEYGLPLSCTSGTSSAADEGGQTMRHRHTSSKLGVGIGLRTPHLAEVLATRPTIGWLEVHAENYMAGGSPLAALEQVRVDYPLSVHGVGLSLGSAEAPNSHHLSRLHRLITRLAPALVSEHLSWSIAGGILSQPSPPLTIYGGDPDDRCPACDAHPGCLAVSPPHREPVEFISVSPTQSSPSPSFSGSWCGVRAVDCCVM